MPLYSTDDQSLSAVLRCDDKLTVKVSTQQLDTSSTKRSNLLNRLRIIDNRNNKLYDSRQMITPTTSYYFPNRSTGSAPLQNWSLWRGPPPNVTIRMDPPNAYAPTNFSYTRKRKRHSSGDSDDSDIDGRQAQRNKNLQLIYPYRTSNEVQSARKRQNLVMDEASLHDRLILLRNDLANTKANNVVMQNHLPKIEVEPLFDRSNEDSQKSSLHSKQLSTFNQSYEKSTQVRDLTPKSQVPMGIRLPAKFLLDEWGVRSDNLFDASIDSANHLYAYHGIKSPSVVADRFEEQAKLRNETLKNYWEKSQSHTDQTQNDFSWSFTQHEIPASEITPTQRLLKRVGQTSSESLQADKKHVFFDLDKNEIKFLSPFDSVSSATEGSNATVYNKSSEQSASELATIPKISSVDANPNSEIESNGRMACPSKMANLTSENPVLTFNAEANSSSDAANTSASIQLPPAASFTKTTLDDTGFNFGNSTMPILFSAPSTNTGVPKKSALARRRRR